MKQLKEWFAMLPEPIRTEAMALKLMDGATLETEYKNMACAMSDSFWWDENGGEDKWEKIWQNATNGLYDTHSLPTVAETIKMLMDAAKRENMALTIHVEPLQGEEKRIDLSNKNKE